MTKLIDNKIESIFKIAQEEQSDTTAHLPTSEFFDQLIELCDDICWLILRIPENSTGRRLLKKYVNGFEEVLETLRGMERIWWSIRRGYSGLPRNRDYSTAHLFSNLKTDAIEEARGQFNEWIDDLAEFISVLKQVDIEKRPSVMRSSKLIFIAFNIIKKIRLNNYFVQQDQPNDFILDSSESLISLLKDLTSCTLIIPPSILTIHRLSCSLNLHLHELIEMSEVMREDEWFKVRLGEVDGICEEIDEIDEINPIR